MSEEYTDIKSKYKVHQPPKEKSKSAMSDHYKRRNNTMDWGQSQRNGLYKGLIRKLHSNTTNH